MFAKLAVIISSLAILAAATPFPGGGSGSEPASSCSTAPVQCCDQTGTASSEPFAGVLAGLGVVVQDVNALVGLSCSSVNVVGVGSGATCDTNAVCCQDNSLGGLAAIGCVPVDLGA
ncbi:fungal hydrophobin-domain-containing protein [Daedaleopsis nitida]|nr:fungal hydrophobin-domain-containing protein [Daedaleopsis nitida]